MKEINLQDLLNLADASAHDGICDFWNQKAIHYLVVFTSTEEDFEIIGVGPSLPCATLEEAERHVIPGKKPEYYIKCPAAVVKRLQPKLAPAGLHQPTPSMKGRTSVPFVPHPEPTPAPPPPAAVKAASPPAPAAPLMAEEPPPPVDSAPAPTDPIVLTDENRQLLQNYAARLAALDARERALAEREAQLEKNSAEVDRLRQELLQKVVAQDPVLKSAVV